MTGIRFLTADVTVLDFGSERKLIAFQRSGQSIVLPPLATSLGCTYRFYTEHSTVVEAVEKDVIHVPGEPNQQQIHLNKVITKVIGFPDFWLVV